MDSLFNLFELPTGGGINLLLDLSIKGTVLLLIAGIATTAFRRAPASMRHFFWFLALGGLIVLPVLPSVLPTWQIPLLPKSTTVDAALENQTASIKKSDMLSLSEEKQDKGLVTSGQKPASNEIGSSNNNSQNKNNNPAKSGFWNISLNWTQWLFVFWFVGVFILGLRFLIGWFKISRLVQKAQLPENAHWKKTVDKLSSQVQLKRPVVLLKSNQVNLPMTWGLLEPVILLPEDSDNWSKERCQVVLLHELAHIKRFDWLNLVISNFVCALYWFNPMVWIALRQMNKEREKACDDFVLRTGTKASDYADHLLKIIRSVQYWKWTSPVTVSMARRSQLEGRLLAILNPKLSRKLMSPLLALLIFFTISSFVLPLAAMDLWMIPENPIENIPQTSQMEANEFGDRETVIANQPLIIKEEIETKSEEDTEPNLSKELDEIESEEIAKDPETVELQQPRVQTKVEQDSLVVQSLIDALKDEDWEVRKEAAWALGEMEDRKAVRALSQLLLKDENWEVRREAASALEQIEDRGAVDALSSALTEDINWEVRREAAEALGQIQDRSAITALESALKDENKEVRREAVEALGDLEDHRTVDALIGTLNDMDWEIRYKAAWALGEMRSMKAVESLITATTDESPYVRKYAVWALGNIEDRSAVDALKKSLSDEFWEVRKYAIEALNDLNDFRAVDPLIGIMQNDPHREVRYEAIEALSDIRDRRAVEPLIATMNNDDDWQIRKKAARALGDIKDRRSIQALTKALKDENKEVRSTAAWALGEMNEY